MDNQKETFQFTYSAKEQAEIEKIRQHYLPQEENKMEHLRKLHNSVNQKAQAWAIGVGVIGSLILGTGMSLLMTPIGEKLGLLAMPMGVAVGVVGLIFVALAYPAYNRVLKKERQRVAPEILRLTEELLK